MGLSYTFNGHAIARAANDLSLHTDVVRSVLDAYLAEELRAAGVTEHTTSVAFSDRADALFAVPKKPSDIEAPAERLTKVEDRLASTRSAHTATLDQRVVDERLRALDDRITKVAEIIGERVSGLVDRLEQIENGDLKAGYDSLGRALTTLPAFPTGGASTAEAAAEAVLPVPQRGDRVRLEGAKSTGQTRLKDGWYDVVGRYEARFLGDHDQFQVGSSSSIGLYWVYDTDPGLKEVRHAQS